jgi:hypothetical protein
MTWCVFEVCSVAGSQTLIDDARVELATAGVIEAVKRRRNATIFDWLMNAVSYQGISDAVAYGFIEGHERISATEIERQLKKRPSCPKLRGYHVFHGCLPISDSDTHDATTPIGPAAYIGRAIADD